MSKRDPTERNDGDCLMIMGGEIDEGAQSEALEPLSPRRCGRMQLVLEEAYLWSGWTTSALKQSGTGPEN